MTAIQKLLRAALIGLACAAVLPAGAQTGGHEHAQQAGAADTVNGEIRKIDKQARKLTIQHGELTNLGMGAMTMVFRVKEDALLDKAKQGDKVRFTVQQVNGVLTVTALDVVH